MYAVRLLALIIVPRINDGNIECFQIQSYVIVTNYKIFRKINNYDLWYDLLHTR